MSNNHRNQIFNNLNLKETKELVDLWQNNDRVEWSELAFDVIQEILLERLGELPPQNEPIWEYYENNTEVEDDDFLDRYINMVSASIFYKPKEVLWLEKWMNRAAIFLFFGYFGGNILQLPRFQRTVLSFFGGNPELEFIAWPIAIIIFILIVGFQFVVLYFPLKALGSILKILMAMEFNSRMGREAQLPNHK